MSIRLLKILLAIDPAFRKAIKKFSTDVIFNSERWQSNILRDTKEELSKTSRISQRVKVDAVARIFRSWSEENGPATIDPIPRDRLFESSMGAPNALLADTSSTQKAASFVFSESWFTKSKISDRIIFECE